MGLNTTSGVMQQFVGQCPEIDVIERYPQQLAVTAAGQYTAVIADLGVDTGTTPRVI
jgi:hypothetical protein